MERLGAGALDLGTCGKLMMTPSIPAIGRFYLKSVGRSSQLYVSPLNLDPMEPGDADLDAGRRSPAELADATGRFYTQGMPEDTKALEGGVLDRTPSSWHRSQIADEEMVEQYRALLADWKGGSALLLLRHRRPDPAHDVDTLDPGHPR